MLVTKKKLARNLSKLDIIGRESPLTIKQFHAKALKKCAEGKTCHSSLLFENH
jgi:hypothetical protein